MKMRPQMTREYWTPERRAVHSGKCNPPRPSDALQPQDRERIVADAIAGRPYVEIAMDWLVSIGRVSQIARAAGYRRQGAVQ